MLSHFEITSMFETARGCTLIRNLACSMIMMSENAAPIITMEWSLVQLQEASVSGLSFLHNSDLWHQQDQCKCWIIAKGDVFELLLNILTHHLAEHNLKIPQNSQNSHWFYPEHK